MCRILVVMCDTRTKKRRVTLDEVRGQGTIHVWHPTEPDACDVLGVGRTTAWRLAQEGTLPTLRLGRRLVVPVPALLAMLGEQQA